MRTRLSTLRPRLVAILVIVGLVLAFCWAQWSWRQRIDLGNKSVGTVFRQVFGGPIPPGISGMKVAGMSSLSGVVWMRFRVRDVHSFLTYMGQGVRVPINGSARDLSADAMPSQDEADRDHYSHEVGWDEVYAIKHPEAYSFDSNPPGRGWFGQMIVDREQKAVYVHGGLM